MTSQRDEMTDHGVTADSRAAESEDRHTPPSLVPEPDGTGAPDRPVGRPDSPDSPLADEDDVILARDDEPVAAEPAVPAGRGTPVPAGGPAAATGDPAVSAPGQGDVFGTAQGAGEPAAVPVPADGPADGTAAGAVPGQPAAGEPAAAGHVPAAALTEQQWPEIMALFVDDPRASVERAAATASELTAALTASLDREQQHLRASWRDNANTEDLRTALQQYRAFCGRLEGLS